MVRRLAWELIGVKRVGGARVEGYRRGSLERSGAVAVECAAGGRPGVCGSWGDVETRVAVRVVAESRVLLLMMRAGPVIAGAAAVVARCHVGQLGWDGGNERLGKGWGRVGRLDQGRREERRAIVNGQGRAGEPRAEAGLYTGST